MAYNFDVNRTESLDISGFNRVISKIFFYLKESLKVSGWTVIESGDGVTAFTPLNGDIITHTGSGAGGILNEKSWYRIRMPTVNSVQRELLIQIKLASGSFGAAEQHRIKYSYSSGFVNAPIGGGATSTTKTPSASDETFVAGGFLSGPDTDANPQFTDSRIYQYASTTSVRYHLATGGASEGYGFWCAAYPAGGGNPVFSFVFEPLINGTFPLNDIDPYIFYNSYYISGIGPFQAQSLTDPNNGPPLPRCWLGKGTANQGWVYVPGRSYGSYGNYWVKSLGINPYTGKDDLLPIMYGRNAGYSNTIQLVGTVKNSYDGVFGYKGIGSQMYWLVSTNRTTGDTLSVNSSKDMIVLRDVAVPWCGITPII